MSESEDEYGPALPPGFQTSKKSNSSSESDDGTYGPALPTTSASKPEPCKAAIGPSRPKLPSRPSQNSSDSESDSSSGSSDDDRSRSKRQKVIGPSVPAHLMPGKMPQDSEKEDSTYIGPVLPTHLKHLEKRASVSVEQGSDSDDGMIGPSLGLQAMEGEISSAAEIEMRAQKMHAKLTGQPEDNDAEAPAGRETWMTELPTLAIKKQYGLENRQFRKNKAPVQDSSWTDSPQEREKKEKERPEPDGKRKKSHDHYVPTEKEKQMEKDIEEYNKKNRPDSLLEMHEKKLKKKKKKEKKKKKKKDKKAEERRPFDRDQDLQVNRIDDAKRKAMIKRSQELGSRFKTGGMGTSFL